MMQFRFAVTIVLLALSSAESLIVPGPIHRRQEGTGGALTTSAPESSQQPTSRRDDSTTSTERSILAEATTTHEVPLSATNAESTKSHSFTTDAASLETFTAQTSAGNTATGTASGAQPASTPAKAEHEKLPLSPTITPALGITGVILILSGTALCLVGIKHKWLYVVLSTAFLASLGVTVLIIYVMNPPVSDAVQGGYMVAAVITGLIFGAVALIFKEVTEGLGCLLGGFCLAMWFLVLSPGGLVASTTGRAILIAAFCLAFFALSFSHYTRNYGLIFCTSFAGAQIAILGVDCFSRAGLKEFWLYLWHLNHDVFPINTTTYPMTRGIRVEIACTVIIFLFGVMSQFKLWKVVKERRAKKAADRLRDDENRDNLEEALGRDIEANNQRDRARWEATYGDKDQIQVHVDSPVGSSIDEVTTKQSISVREQEIDRSVELAEKPDSTSIRGSKQDPRPVLTVRATSEDEAPVQVHTQPDEPSPEKTAMSRSASQSTRRIESRRASEADRQDAMSAKDWAERPNAPPAPTVVPLPFHIPGQGEARSSTTGNKIPDSKDKPLAFHEEPSVLPLTQSSLMQLAQEACDSSEVTCDEGASSVAATADEDVGATATSLRHLSTALSASPSNTERKGLAADFRGERDQASNPRQSFIEMPVDEHDDEMVIRPERAVEPVPEADEQGTLTKQIDTTQLAKESVGDNESVTGQDNAEGVSNAGSLSAHLPEKLSKVAMTYRTNEWAKHIAEADEPEAEEVSRSSSPGIHVDHAFAQEIARPVDVEDLKPPEAGTKPNSNSSRTSMMSPGWQNEQKASGGNNTPAQAAPRSSSATVLARQSSGNDVPGYTRSNSAMPLKRQNTSDSAMIRPRLSTRNVSQPLVESPIEEIPPIAQRNVSSPLEMASTNNLMDERNERVLRKPKSTSFMALAPTPEFNVTAPSDSGSTPNCGLESNSNGTAAPSDQYQAQVEEEMTLADRRALMQQHREKSSGRQDTWPKPDRASMTANQNIIYDSHQPNRNNTVNSARQSQMLAQWRQTLQQDAASRQSFLTSDQAHQTMVNERRQSQMQHQMRDTKREQRQSAMDTAMRSGQLHGAHRDAMRKMQARANKRTPQ